MNILFAGVVISAALAAAPVAVPPGADLITTLALTAPADARYGLDGSPPGAQAARPLAPQLPGQHFLVEFDRGGAPRHWVRFVVTGDPGTPALLTLDVDGEPPEISVQTNDVVRRDSQIYAGDRSSFAIEATDRSGLHDAPSLWLNGIRQNDPARPDWPQDDVVVRVEARASDGLGNAGEADARSVMLDRTPPSMRASRAKPRDGLDADIIAPGETIVITLEDAGAGLLTFSLDGQEFSLDGTSAQSLEVTMSGSNTEYLLADQLGNTVHGALPLRMDSEPPRLVFIADGVEQPVNQGARLPRSMQLDVQAVDMPAGVSRACIELSIWYGECRPLPISLLGIEAGRYSLIFRASDRLGQRAFERYQIEVLP